MTGPVVAVLDPRYPFSLAAVVACEDADRAADTVVEMRRAWPDAVVSVVYPSAVAS